MSTAAEIAAAFDGKRSGVGWTAHCPAHDDRNASLSISDGRDKVLVHCHAGCSQDQLIAEINRRGFTLDGRPGRLPARRLIAEYDYRDEHGQVLFQAQRWAPKEFRQRRPDAKGGWINNLDGVVRVPYRLPEMLAAPEKPVFVVEGEKDADGLASEGLIATTNAGGAGKWRSELCRWFKDRDVVILPDNDDPGRKHAEDVARKLSEVVRRVRVVEMPDLKAKGDVSDWLDAGYTIRDLRRLALKAPAWEPAVESRIPSDVVARNVAALENTNPRNPSIPAGSSDLATLHPENGVLHKGADASDASTDEAEIGWLATLPPLAYERERDDAATRLRVRVSILDRLVDKARPKAEEGDVGATEQGLGIGDVEPWREPVDGAALLDEIASTIRRYVVMHNQSADATALWILHTHALDAAYITARLSINSPEMRCGKTTFLDVLKTIVARPLPVANITTATLFR